MLEYKTLQPEAAAREHETGKIVGVARAFKLRLASFHDSTFVEKLKQCFPDKDHLFQVIHHACVWLCPVAYCVFDNEDCNVIRIVHLEVDSAFASAFSGLIRPIHASILKSKALNTMSNEGRIVLALCN